MEPKQGKWGLWYIDGVSAGFATKDQAEEHVRMNNELATLAAAARDAEAHAASVRARTSSQGQWVGTIVSLLALIVFISAVWSYISSRPKKPPVERASTAEIMECKDRIEREFVGTLFTVNTKPVIGTSSDKLGPGGTSRVKMRFDLTSPGGEVISRTAICQFAPGAPPVMVLTQ